MKKFISILVLVIAMIVMMAASVWAADNSSSSGVGAWQIVGYAIGVVLNIGAVGAIRLKAYNAAKKTFRSSGRFATIAVFVISLLYTLVISQGEVLASSEKITQWLNEAWILAGASIGTHTVLKTSAEKWCN